MGVQQHTEHLHADRQVDGQKYLSHNPGPEKNEATKILHLVSCNILSYTRQRAHCSSFLFPLHYVENSNHHCPTHDLNIKTGS